MATPVKREFVLPENCPKDIELMSIWAQAANEYAHILTPQQMISAANWFKSYIDSVTSKSK